MPAPRIYADFHNLDDSNRLRLTCAGTRDDLESQGVELKEGSVLTFYMDDANDRGEPDRLLAEGVTHYDEEQKCWIAVVDWQAVHHESDATRMRSGKKVQGAPSPGTLPTGTPVPGTTPATD
jgi:hypothetical protein